MGVHQRHLDAQLDKADAEEMQYRRAYNAAYNESEAALAMFALFVNEPAVFELSDLIEAKANDQTIGTCLRKIIQAVAAKEATRVADEAARTGFQN
jgi:hypothetical protein